MGRPPHGKEEGLKKGPWTPEEDKKLIDYIEKNGHGSWRALPKQAGLNRCGKSCRLRWTNYLRPDIKRGKFSEEEERLIIHLHSLLGNKWSAIATNLPGRTDNEIKNYWNTHLKKQLLRMGIDPVTHRPRADLAIFANLPTWLAKSNVGCVNAAEQLGGLQLILQGVFQALLSPPPQGNFDLMTVMSHLCKMPEFQSSLTLGELVGSGHRTEKLTASDIQPQSPYNNTIATSRTSPVSSDSPENVTSELLHDMINPAADDAFQPWRYPSERYPSETICGGDYCWEEILGNIPTVL